MDPSEDALYSHQSSILRTSNLGFSTTIFDDQGSESSTSVGEQHDPFDVKDDDDGADTKYLPMQRQLDRMFGMADDKDDADDMPNITVIADVAHKPTPPLPLPTNATTTTDSKSTTPSHSLLGDVEAKLGVSHAHAPPKRKSIVDLFPWLKEVEKINQQLLGSITELKTTFVLDAMDFLIAKLSDNYHEYYKAPKVANALAGFIRVDLYIYRNLYAHFEMVRARI